MAAFAVTGTAPGAVAADERFALDAQGRAGLPGCQRLAGARSAVP